jgi:HAD superfamily hydrolase (TIGR01549 family)
MTEYYNFYEHYHDRASLFPGIDELLSTLHSRSVPVGLYTGKGRRTTTITLDKFNLTRYFDSIVTGDDVTQFKPSGEGLQKILQQFSLQPEHLLMVGDSLADVKASRATGVKIAAALWDSNSKEKVLQAKPDYVFYAVDAFRAWLQSAVM